MRTAVAVLAPVTGTRIPIGGVGLLELSKHAEAVQLKLISLATVTMH